MAWGEVPEPTQSGIWSTTVSGTTVISFLGFRILSMAPSTVTGFECKVHIEMVGGSGSMPEPSAHAR